MTLQEQGKVRRGALPRRREDLEPVGTGRMGSAFFRWRFARADLPAVLDHDWSQLGRRLFIDPERGEVTLMAPSGPHAFTSALVGHLVFEAARALSIPYIPADDTKWSPPGSRRVEADKSFYLGGSALLCREVRDADQLNTFIDANPPQLVVEAERSHGAAARPDVYRDLGAIEMWRIDARRWPVLTVEILDLQCPGGVRAVDYSAVLPGLTPALIVRALDEARRDGAEVIPGLLAVAGVGREALAPGAEGK